MIQILLMLFAVFSWAEVKYPCVTSYDNLEIPHVKTNSLEEYYYCFGLNHGRDRAWSMDYFRRVAQGRNAEVYGFSSLKSDLMMRLLDLPSVVWKDFPEDQKKLLDLYAAGVNEGFKTGKDAFEFKDLSYGPEAWRASDSILVLLLQSFDQTRKTFSRDYDEERFKERWKDRTEELFSEDDIPWNNTILKEGEYQKSLSHQTSKNSRAPFKIWGEFPEVFGKESGSNNWVISSKKSKSGKAILANDPHLDLKTPLFWYWINIETPQGKVMGGSVPGVPVIPSGTNGKVSWGLTNSYNNSADAMLLKDYPKNSIETFRPTVMVKFWFFKIPFFFKSFEKLTTGHRILPLELNSEGKIILRWSGFSLMAKDIMPMFKLHEVKNVSQMDELLKEIGLPSWNFVFADNLGEIGYRMIGKTYLSTEKNSYGLNSVTLEDLKTEKYLEVDDRPHVLKPNRNYIYTANNRHWPKDSKFYGGRGYSDSFRGFRIDELMNDKQDVESTKTIQCDGEVVDARFFLPRLNKYLNESPFSPGPWFANDNSQELPVYRRLIDLLLEEWSVNEFALFRLLDNLTSSQVVELKRIYQQAKADAAGRNWGEIHRVKFSHLSKNDSWKFSPEFAGIGDTHTVNPGTSKWNAKLKVYEQSSGASMRMIIQMDSEPKIWLALPGRNRNYQNRLSTDSSPWKRWKNCEYSEVKF
jgi:penicillin amidase